MAKVAEALKGLTSYLHAENARLDIEFKEAKVDLAAQHISKRFGQLPPGATPEMMQALQFELISDAAALGGLQENLPLISGLHNSMLQTRSITEAERHDAALGEAIQSQLGIDIGQMSGTDAMAFFKTQESAKKDITYKDEQGRTFLSTFNVKGKETFKKMIDPLGTQQKLSMEFGQESKIAEMRSNLALRNAMTLAKQKQSFELDQMYGTTGARQFPGMNFLRTQTTPAGDQLYTPKTGGGVFALRSDGQLTRYVDNDIIPRKVPAKNIDDVLAALDRTQKLFGPQRYRAANELLETEAGRKLIGRITGSEDIETFTEVDKAGRTVIRQGVLQQMETFFAQDRVEDVLKDMFSEEELQARGGEMGALNKFALAYATEKSVENILFQSIPRSEKDQIVSPKEWNTGWNNIEVILDPTVPNEQAGGVTRYINQMNGNPLNQRVTMEDAGWMKFENKQWLSSTVSKYSNPILRPPVKKTPTLEDITIPREEDRTPVNKYPDKVKTSGSRQPKELDSMRRMTEVELGWAKYDINNPEFIGNVDPFERFKLRK
jgi:hypothetical protein